MIATAEPAIRVEGLGKCYRIQHKGVGKGGAGINRFSEQLVEWAKAPLPQPWTKSEECWPSQAADER